MSHIGLVSGFWGQNIGNAFFNLGGKYALERAGHRVSFVQDQPAYWTFRNEAKGNYGRSFSLLEALEVDLVVVQGPLLTRNLAKIWEPTLAALAAHGVHWAILSGAFRAYTRDELQVAADLIARYPPLFISTRDDVTADRLSDVFPSVRSGVCSAFFLGQSYEPPRLRGGPFIAMTFDHFGEPDVIEGGRDLKLDDCEYSLKFHARHDWLAGRSKAHAYLASMLDRRTLPKRVGRHVVLRPEHRTNPHLPFKIYAQANGLASDEPWTYLTAYSAAEVTISDRVHACVAALAYGNRAILHNPTTKRHALFSSIGVEDIGSAAARLCPGRVEAEFDSVVRFLKSI